MRFNPVALLVSLGFFVLLAFAVAGGGSTLHVGEAVATALIAASIAGLAFRRRQRLR